MSGARFVRFYPSDWRSGCIGLTPEEIGVYISVCAHAWETGARLTTDDALAASRLMLDVRMWRRIKNNLVAKGKLHVAEDGIYSPRAERELAAAQAGAKQTQAPAAVGAGGNGHDREHQDGRVAVERREPSRETLLAEVSEKSPGSLGEVAEIFVEKSFEINGPLKSLITITNKEEEKKEQCSSARAAKPLPRIDTDKLIAACNGALDNPVNCLGLLSAATPIMWLETGCDMDRDIIPTLQAMGKKYHGKRIRSWEYFSGAIQDARNKRLHGTTKAAADESEIQLRAIKAIVGPTPARKLLPDLSNEMMPTDA